MNTQNIALETILRRTFKEEDRNVVQDRAIASVLKDPEAHFRAYIHDPRSFGGRYVASDLMKETFPDFTASLASRDRYNGAVHNASAVLANAMYERVLALPKVEGRHTALLITGVPGGGKTTYILASKMTRPDTHMVYEGQLVRPETTLPKIEKALAAGLKPMIVAVQPTPEWALDNAVQRFGEIGRGASMQLMADIQGPLHSGLTVVRDHYGETVSLQIIDKRDPHQPKLLNGWEHLDILLSEGGREAIYERLEKHLAERVRNHSISLPAQRQARGQPGYDYPFTTEQWDVQAMANLVRLHNDPAAREALARRAF